MIEQSKTKKQLLQELIEMQKALHKELETQDRLIQRFQAIIAHGDLFIQIIDYFPYPIAVFLPDGLLHMVNRTLLTAANLSCSDSIVGKYNILNHPSPQQIGASEAVKRAFTGETVYLLDLVSPLESFIGHTTSKSNSGRWDAVIFPVSDQRKEISHAAVVLINQHNGSRC